MQQVSRAPAFCGSPNRLPDLHGTLTQAKQPVGSCERQAGGHQRMSRNLSPNMDQAQMNCVAKCLHSVNQCVGAAVKIEDMVRPSKHFSQGKTRFQPLSNTSTQLGPDRRDRCRAPAWLWLPQVQGQTVATTTASLGSAPGPAREDSTPADSRTHLRSTGDLVRD